MSDYKSELLVDKQAENERLRVQLTTARNEVDAALTRVKELESGVERLRAELKSCEDVYQLHTNRLRARIRELETTDARQNPNPGDVK